MGDRESPKRKPVDADTEFARQTILGPALIVLGGVLLFFADGSSTAITAGASMLVGGVALLIQLAWRYRPFR